ncbi:MAG: hypothetical protein M1822_009500 [Bathelium mastoideum]|nr:MAG: hypothetical protein M1822_009500 [Bathelium mastoideum]
MQQRGKSIISDGFSTPEAHDEGLNKPAQQIAELSSDVAICEVHGFETLQELDSWNMRTELAGFTTISTNVKYG